MGDVTNLDCFLKGYKASETKRFFPNDWFNHPRKLNGKELPPYEYFHNKVRKYNPLQERYPDYKKLIGNGLTTEFALVRMKLSELPPTGAENCSSLPNTWEHQKMQSLKEFMRWCNNKDVVTILEAMQKMVVSYLNKRIDMLNLRLILPKLAKICLHSSSGAKLCPFTEGDKDLLANVWEDMVGGPSLVFTRKVVVDNTHIRNSTIVCKAITGKDAG